MKMIIHLFKFDPFSKICLKIGPNLKDTVSPSRSPEKFSENLLSVEKSF